jgi:lipid-A-disaccharide synthase
MLETAQRMATEYEYLIPVASTLPREWVAQQTSGVRVYLVNDARAALLHARAAVVASGTATVETALIGTPFIVVYRVSALTYAIGRRLVKVKNYGMVNLIAGREIVPELIQSNFTPENVIGQLNRLIPDGSPRAEMLRDLQDVGRMLRHVSNLKGQTAIERAARAIAETACIVASLTES